MNEKYVRHEDDFDDNDIIWMCLFCHPTILFCLRYRENGIRVYAKGYKRS